MVISEVTAEYAVVDDSEEDLMERCV